MPFGKPGNFTCVPSPQKSSCVSMQRGCQILTNIFPPPLGQGSLHTPAV